MSGAPARRAGAREVSGFDDDPFVRHMRSAGCARVNDRLLLLGNGPSLKRLDLPSIAGNVDTLGMNAAYRFWDRIGWYPTYYACVDTVVVKHHQEEIARLVRERGKNGIRMFYLQKNILDDHPGLRDVPEVVIFDDWFGSFLYRKCPSVTTGTYAVLLAIALGYTEIYLMGIDLNYVEQLPCAEGVGGNVLEIRSRPAANPNYFFDDYQQPGDRYHIPNSVPNLHMNGWVEIGDLAKELHIPIYNGNADSQVRVFPHADIDRILAGAGPA